MYPGEGEEEVFCRPRDLRGRRPGGWLAWPTLESAAGCEIWAWGGQWAGEAGPSGWGGLLLMAPRGLGPTGTGTVFARETR